MSISGNYLEKKQLWEEKIKSQQEKKFGNNSNQIVSNENVSAVSIKQISSRFSVTNDVPNSALTKELNRHDSFEKKDKVETDISVESAPKTNHKLLKKTILIAEPLTKNSNNSDIGKSMNVDKNIKITSNIQHLYNISELKFSKIPSFLVKKLEGYQTQKDFIDGLERGDFSLAEVETLFLDIAWKYRLEDNINVLTKFIEILEKAAFSGEISLLKIRELCKRGKNCLSKISFKSDSNELISTHKILIAAQSPFFHKMFTGPFKESNQNIVNFPTVSFKMLEIIMSIIEGNSSFQKELTSEIGSEILEKFCEWRMNAGAIATLFGKVEIEDEDLLNLLELAIKNDYKDLYQELLKKIYKCDPEDYSRRLSISSEGFKDLNIKISSDFVLDGLIKVGRIFNQLKIPINNLYLQFSYGYETDVKTFKQRPLILKTMMEGFPNLQQFNIEGNSLSDKEIAALLNNCIQLKELNLKDVENLDKGGFASILDKCPNLKSLTLKAHYCNSPLGNSKYLDNVKAGSIEVFNICGYQIHQNLISIIEKFPQLKSIKISDNEIVKVDFLYELTKKCNQIREIGQSQ